jgi:hypothetical protein
VIEHPSTQQIDSRMITETVVMPNEQALTTNECELYFQSSNFSSADDSSTGSRSSTGSSDAKLPAVVYQTRNEELSLLKGRYDTSRNRYAIVGNEGFYKANVELLNMLQTANAPIYLFDSIMQWTKKNYCEHQIDFMYQPIQSRAFVLKQIKTQFDLHNLEPQTKKVTLPGSGTTVNLVFHSFKYSLYSLLNDQDLMHPDNLLVTESTIDNGVNPHPRVIGDIDTGSVYIQASQTVFAHGTSNVLCPIIFFIDRTHTDVQGRLCLEQVRFTLGIFNSQTRNEARAWRTLGYIADQQNISTTKTVDKVTDYHYMISVILEEWKLYQQQPIEWDLQFLTTHKTVFFHLQVLFLMGDTEGHDKLAGRYLSRSNIKRLCRYCDCPSEFTDDPDYKGRYNIHSDIFNKVKHGNADLLQDMSMHRVENAWADIKFCDPKRGLFGSL